MKTSLRGTIAPLRQTIEEEPGHLEFHDFTFLPFMRVENLSSISTTWQITMTQCCELFKLCKYRRRTISSLYQESWNGQGSTELYERDASGSWKLRLHQHSAEIKFPTNTRNQEKMRCGI
uniref:Peptide chain release factor 3 n=1 Tax=Lygus hesperus TaxID=30085 RepID=A0A0A9WRP4_LYGHE